jgi:hypothetical protein
VLEVFVLWSFWCGFWSQNNTSFRYDLQFDRWWSWFVYWTIYVVNFFVCCFTSWIFVKFLVNNWYTLIVQCLKLLWSAAGGTAVRYTMGDASKLMTIGPTYTQWSRAATTIILCIQMSCSSQNQLIWSRDMSVSVMLVLI